MPGKKKARAASKAQRKLAGLAEHHPEKVYKRNKSIIGMTHGQLHEIASTKEKKLPNKVKKKK